MSRVSGEAGRVGKPYWDLYKRRGDGPFGHTLNGRLVSVEEARRTARPMKRKGK